MKNTRTQNTEDFHYRGLFFSVARHTPLTFFHKILRIFTTEYRGLFVFSSSSHTPNLFSQNTADFHYRCFFVFSSSSHTPNLFSQNTADFHYRGFFVFSSSSHTPNLFSQNSENTADFHYRGLFFSFFSVARAARHTPLTFFHKILRIFTTEYRVPRPLCFQ